MPLCYSDKTSPGDFVGFDPLRADPVKAMMKHYSNYLYLTFMLENGNMTEKHEASKELVICERKMNYWKRQPHFSTEEAARQILALKKDWGC